MIVTVVTIVMKRRMKFNNLIKTMSKMTRTNSNNHYNIIIIMMITVVQNSM